MDYPELALDKKEQEGFCDKTGDEKIFHLFLSEKMGKKVFCKAMCVEEK
jgi:hypothetical protein